MNCSECEGTYREKSGSLHFKDKYVGPLTVEHIKYYKCDQCGDRLFSVKAARRIESKASRVLDEILQSKPLRDFITAAKAAKVLGISRQALHKHRRIRRGFIFQTRFAGKTVYLEESVQRFMEAGDGRFPIGGHQTPREEYSKSAGKTLYYPWGPPIGKNIPSNHYQVAQLYSPLQKRISPPRRSTYAQ